MTSLCGERPPLPHQAESGTRLSLPRECRSERVLKRSFNSVAQLGHSPLLNPFNQGLVGEFQARRCFWCFSSDTGRQMPVRAEVGMVPTTGIGRAAQRPTSGNSILEMKPRQTQEQGERMATLNSPPNGHSHRLDHLKSAKELVPRAAGSKAKPVSLFY